MYPEDVMADILIVEDNKELAVLLADFLCAAGYSVCTAATGNEALELYKEKGAKLVLLDIMLPGTGHRSPATKRMRRFRYFYESF